MHRNTQKEPASHRCLLRFLFSLVLLRVSTQSRGSLHVCHRSVAAAMRGTAIHSAKTSWCGGAVFCALATVLSPPSHAEEKGGRIPPREFLLIDGGGLRVRETSHLRTSRSTRARSLGCTRRSSTCGSAPFLPCAPFEVPFRCAVHVAASSIRPSTIRRGKGPPFGGTRPVSDLVRFQPWAQTGRFGVSVPFRPDGRSGSTRSVLPFIRWDGGKGPVAKGSPVA